MKLPWTNLSLPLNQKNTSTLTQSEVPSTDDLGELDSATETSGNPFIYIVPNAIDLEDCKNIIERFENNPQQQYQGIMGRGVDRTHKDTRDITISEYLTTWQDVDDMFFENVSRYIPLYEETISDRLGIKYSHENYPQCGEQVPIKPASIVDGDIGRNGSDDNGYLLQRYEPGGHYEWHHDHMTNLENTRYLTVMWYLNDVEEGGETEFYDGTKIKPKAGTLVMFPATWTFYHRALPPVSGNKYISTTWIRHTMQPLDDQNQESR